MWQPTPAIRRDRIPAPFAYTAHASSIGTPNLLLASPVAMWGCVFGSTSGLTRSATGATRPTSAATRASRSSSETDSTLNERIPASRPARISASDLPTPENTTPDGSPPAASTRSSSPPETMSNPEPSRARASSTARFELAFTA